jgi:hypothetical protein
LLNESNLPGGQWFQTAKRAQGAIHMGKAALLWLIGVPIPVIVVLWLIFG